MSEEEMMGMLRMIQEVLRRIEDRQIKTTKMVEEVKETEGAVVGSFASSDLGEK